VFRYGNSRVHLKISEIKVSANINLPHFIKRDLPISFSVAPHQLTSRDFLLGMIVQFRMRTPNRWVSDLLL